MPRESNYQQSRLEKYAVSIADIQKQLAELEKEILQEECTLQRYISTVPDSRMRLILQYRFVDGLKWRDVARKIDDTEDSVKMALQRLLKGEESNDPQKGY